MIPEHQLDKIRRGTALVIEGLGFDPDSEAFAQTPHRVAKLCNETLDHEYSELGKMTSFAEAEHDQSGVMVVGVPFYSFCAHHMLPFIGVFGAAYIPDGTLLGLSKIVRIVRHPCKKPTTQEEITKAAVEGLMTHAKPKGAIVWIKAMHMCMCLRGVKSPGSTTVTIAHRGEYTDHPELRSMFLDECRAAGNGGMSL